MFDLIGQNTPVRKFERLVCYVAGRPVTMENKFRYCRKPPKDRTWAKTRRISHKPWKSIHGFDLGVCPRKYSI